MSITKYGQYEEDGLWLMNNEMWMKEMRWNMNNEVDNAESPSLSLTTLPTCQK